MTPGTRGPTQCWARPASFSPVVPGETPPAPPATPPRSPAVSTSLWTESGAAGPPGLPVPLTSSAAVPAVTRELSGGRGLALLPSTEGRTARERENSLGTAPRHLVLVGQSSQGDTIRTKLRATKAALPGYFLLAVSLWHNI